MTARTWTLTIPAPGPWLTANIERHHRRRAPLVRLWRQAVLVACQAQKLPTGITPVYIEAVVYHVGRAPVRDRLNLSPTIKALVDGLTPPRQFTRKGKVHVTVGYGLIPDDSDAHVLDTTWRLEKAPATVGIGRVVLTIREAVSQP